MKDLQQKVSYLQGLVDGLDLEESKEGKVISGILEVLEDMAEYLAVVNDELDDMEDYLESVDEDLADVEDEVFGAAEEDEEEEDIHYVDVECHGCHEVVSFDSAILYEEEPVEVICPNCETVIYTNEIDIDLEEYDQYEEEEEDDDHHHHEDHEE